MCGLLFAVWQDPSSAKPSARVAPGLVSVSSSSLWLFGGRQGIDMGEGALDDLWRFDLDTLKWSCVQESTEKAGGPTKRSFHQMVRREKGRSIRKFEEKWQDCVEMKME